MKSSTGIYGSRFRRLIKGQKYFYLEKNNNTLEEKNVSIFWMNFSQSIFSNNQKKKIRTSSRTFWEKKKCNYNPKLVWNNKIPKRFFFVHEQKITLRAQTSSITLNSKYKLPFISVIALRNFASQEYNITLLQENAKCNMISA